MRLTAKRLQRLFQRIQRGARISQHLLTLIQHMQTVQPQRADNDDLAVVIITIGRRTLSQASVRRLHQDYFIGLNAGAKDFPEFKQRAGDNHRQSITLTRAKTLTVTRSF